MLGLLTTLDNREFQENLLVGDDFKALLADFGLAMALEDSSSGLTTSSFHPRNTYYYASPEVLLDVTRRSLASDVWAYGCLVWEVRFNVATLN